MNVALTVALGYLLLVLAVGLLGGRGHRDGVAAYVAGDRSMNVLMLYFVLGAAIFSSFAFLGAPGWAYSRGAATYFILVYGAFGFVPMYFLGPRARAVGARFGFVTQAEMLAHRFDSRSLSVLMAVLSVIAFIPYLVLQMKGAGYILEVVSAGEIPASVGAGLTYGVVTLYVLFSGVMGVGWTSVLQGMLMMTLAWSLGLYLPFKLYGGIGPMFDAIAAQRADLLQMPGLTAQGVAWDWWGYSSAILVTAIGFSCWPHFFMKAFAARDDRSMKLSVVLYPTFQLFLVPIIIIGFAGVLAYPGVSPADTILPVMLVESSLPAWLVGLACAGTLAASMSSGDAILHAAGSIGARDGVGPLLRAPLDDRRETLLIRALVLVVAAVAYYFAVWSELSLVELLVMAYGGVAQIFPLLIATFFWSGVTRAGALGGLVAGLTVNALFLSFPEARPLPLHEGAYGLAANVLTLWLLSRWTAPLPREHVRAYTGSA